MKLDLFHYHCPPELIAQEPAQKRDGSRLLVFGHNGGITDHTFDNLPDILNEIFLLKAKNQRLLLIANNSRVYSARIRAFRKTGGQCEIFVLELESQDASCRLDGIYSCLIKPKSKIKQNEILYLDKNQQTPIFQIVDLENSKIKPLFSESMSEFLEKYGSTPLPPYIKRASNEKTSEATNAITDDKSRYQNVYAHTKNTGSSAAPTAGFHFTDNLLSTLLEFNIDIDYVTLHVGLGTFLPVKVENISDHVMHTENYFISDTLVKKIFYHMQNNWPIVFVGTTSLRSVESFLRKISNEKLNFHNNHFLQTALAHANKWHSTNLFLYPKDENSHQSPLIGNALITNFHQPESSLLMLVASVIGYCNLNKVYKHAVNKEYRFFSYGDSSLLIF